MKRDTINYFVVGIFVLILFLSLLIVLYKITGSTGPTDQYFVSYDNVEGIKYGTSVLFEGYQIGQIESVDPVRDSGEMQFKLTLSVIKGWTIPKDSIAQIVKSGLLSAVSIDINEGNSKESLRPNDFIQSQEASDLFSSINDVAADIRDLTRNSLRPLLDNMNNQVGMVATDIRSLVTDSMKPVIDNQLKSLLVRLNMSADGLLNILNEKNQQNIRQMLANLNIASEDIDTLLTNLERSRESLDGLLAHLDNVIDENDEDIRVAVQDLQKTLSVVSQHINAIAHHLEGSSRNMQEFTRQIRENPGSLLRNSPPSELVNAE